MTAPRAGARIQRAAPSAFLTDPRVMLGLPGMAAPRKMGVPAGQIGACRA